MENVCKLTDGRDLGYAWYGPADGKTVLYFHGTPSSRLEPLILEQYGVPLPQLLVEKQIRLLAIDRPGMGLSHLNPSGTFLSFAEDVRQLLRHLQIPSIPVIAWSGGGPYALSIASAFPELVPAVFIICGFTRTFDREVRAAMNRNKWYFKAAASIPQVLSGIMNRLSRSKKKPRIPQVITGLPDVDHQFLADPHQLYHLSVCTMKEACRHNADGAVHEAQLYHSPYPYSLKKVKVPVHYWWGTVDGSVIRLHAEAVEKDAPHHFMHYKEGEGHISIYIHFFEEVLEKVKDYFQQQQIHK